MAETAESALPDYPFVDYAKFQTDFWTMTKAYFKRTVASLFKTDPEKRETVISKLLGAVVDSVYTMNEQEFCVKWQEIFPKVAAWQAFAESPADIKFMYTLEYKRNGNTYEVPIYLQAGKDTDPTDEMIAKAIDTVRDTHESPYNDESASTFYRAGFSKIGAEKFTRGDFKRLPDPKNFRRWFVMDECWNMQQQGRVKEVKEKKDTKGTKWTVRKYGQEPAMSKFLYWAIGDKIYDMIDAPFDPMQRYMEKAGLPPDAQQTLIKEEYKMIAGIRRSFMRGTGRYPLDFDLTD